MSTDIMELLKSLDAYEDLASDVLTSLDETKLPARTAALLERAVAVLAPLGQLLSRLSVWIDRERTRSYIDRFKTFRDAGMPEAVMVAALTDADLQSKLLAARFELAASRLLDSWRTHSNISSTQRSLDFLRDKLRK